MTHSTNPLDRGFPMLNILPRERADGIMRRYDVGLLTPEESLLRSLVSLIEKLGASRALTDTVYLLDQARDRLADHLEGRA